MARLKRIFLLTLFGLLLFAAGYSVAWLNRRFSTWTDGVSISRTVRDGELRQVLWEDPVPVNLAPDTTDHIEPAISADGRVLVFAWRREGGAANLYEAERQGDHWGEPRPLMAINTDSDELGPELNRSGDLLFFYSDRPGGPGGYNIWMSRRRYGEWEAPEVLGDSVNSIFDEYDPALDAGGRQLAFASNRPVDAPPVVDEMAWRATLRERSRRPPFNLYLASRIDVEADGEGEGGIRFDQASYSAEVNSDADDGQPAFSPNGDFLYFSSNREGGYGGFDIYRMRLTPRDPLGPQALPPPVNSPGDEMDPALWHEGHGLVFSSNRGQDHPDNFTLWRTTSREVIMRPYFTWQNLRVWVERYGLWILLSILALLLCLWLWRKLYGSEATLGPRARALAMSGLVHALLLFLLGMWFLGQAVVEQSAGPLEIRVSEQNLAREKLAMELREEIAEVSVPESTPLSEQVRLPEEFAPPELPEALRADLPEPSPVPSDFALPDALESRPRETADLLETTPEMETLPDVFTDLPAAEMADLREIAQLTEVAMARVAPSPEAAPEAPAAPAPQARMEAAVEALSPLERQALPLPAPEFSVTEALTEAPVAEVRPVESVALPETTGLDVEIPALTAGLPARSADARAELTLLPEVGQSPSPVADTASPEAPAAPEALTRSETRVDAAPAPTRRQQDLPEAALDVSHDLLTVDLPATPRAGEARPLPESEVTLADAIEIAMPRMNPDVRLELETAPVASLSYHLRDPAVRRELIEQLGGSDETEAAIRRALEFFSRTQEAEGHWDIHKWGGDRNHDIAATSLVMLCFLGHGVTHQSEGAYQQTMEKALNWVLAQQGEDGALVGKDMYDHHIAAITLAEMYAMTRDDRIREPLERALAYAIAAQHGETGGWRYRPGEQGDTSVFGWAVMALTSAQQAGLSIPAETLARADGWLDRVSAGRDGGRYGYDSRDARRRAMTAEGMFARQLLGAPRNRADMIESAAFLSTELPEAGDVDLYHWYYGTLALFQHQGETWDQWNNRLRTILVDSQIREGEHAGSWAARGRYDNRMGRIVSTAIATLCLEVYYRYLPMYSGEY
ncbi:MAG: PD40 domain-containing protein [Verrucomicrobia bacterium]|nr:PD40 domain-containing protein [Verrucomicrobiota bacterium]